MLSEDEKEQVSYEVEKIRDIAEHIRNTTNIKDELIFDMANVIYLNIFGDK